METFMKKIRDVEMKTMNQLVRGRTPEAASEEKEKLTYIG